MENGSVITTIDVGTTKICTIVAMKVNGRYPEIIAHSVVPCTGLKKGNVEDINITAEGIKSSLEVIRSRTDLPINAAYVGITGAHIDFDNRVDVLSHIGSKGVITSDEVNSVPELVMASSKTAGREIIHAIPTAYDIDGHNGINNPVGMHAVGLKVKTHVVTAGDTFVSNLESAVVTAGLKVKQMVLEPLASSEALLTSKEKERGAAIVDMGGGTTDIVAFRGGSILYTTVVPVGGFQFTNDISVTFNTSFDEAEQLKLKYASTEPASVDMREQVQMSVLGRSAKVNVYRRDICQLVRERGMELIRLIDLKLQESGIGQDHKAQVIMTGGASALPGLFEMAQQYMPNCNIRIGFPDHLSGMSEELEAPAYSTGVGMLLWALRNERVANGSIGRKRIGARKSTLGGLINRINSFMGTK